MVLQVSSILCSELYIHKCISHPLSLCTGSSDFERMETHFITINAINNATDIAVFPVNDEITLEYNDRVLLRFTPAVTNLFSDLANQFEYIRGTAVVNIIDNDCKCPFPYNLPLKKCVSLFSFGDQF